MSVYSDQYVYLVYDKFGNIIQSSTNYPNATPPSQLIVLAGDAVNARGALAQKNNYMVQNGQVIPAVTIHIDRAFSKNGSFNLYTLNLTASDGGTHQATLNVLDKSEPITIPGQYQVSLHQAVQNQITIDVSGQGLITTETVIGGSDVSNTVQIQVYPDASGLLNIAPVNKSTLVAHYTSMVPADLSTADLTTSDSLLMQGVFGILFPALTSGANPIVVLDDNQKNALQDIIANVLPNIVTTLETSAPVPGADGIQHFDLHYRSYRYDLAIAKKAFEQYATDIQIIPNLI